MERRANASITRVLRRIRHRPGRKQHRSRVSRSGEAFRRVRDGHVRELGNAPFIISMIVVVAVLVGTLFGVLRGHRDPMGSPEVLERAKRRNAGAPRRRKRARTSVSGLSDRHARPGLGRGRARAVAVAPAQAPQLCRRCRDAHRAARGAFDVRGIRTARLSARPLSAVRAAQSRADATIARGCSSRAACTATRRAACTARCSSSTTRGGLSGQPARGALRESLGLRAHPSLERRRRRSESLVPGRQPRRRVRGVAAPGCAVARTLSAAHRSARDDRLRRERVPPCARGARRKAVRTRRDPGWLLPRRRQRKPATRIPARDHRRGREGHAHRAGRRRERDHRLASSRPA